MVPLLLGYLFLCPATAYLQALFEGFEGGFISFIPQFFWYQIFHYHGYGHLWFLLYLFIFSMLCLPLFIRWQRDESRVRRIGNFLLKGHRMLLPIGLIILLETCLRPFFHTDQTFIFDWANDAVYLSVFVFGYVFAADERIQIKLREYFKPSIVIGALSLATLFFVNIMSQAIFSQRDLTLLWVFAKGVYECSAIIFLLNIGKACFNQGGKAIRYLSGASFTVYLFHFLPVTFFTLLFFDLNIHIFIKFLMVVFLSYLVVFVIYELWRRVTQFRKRIDLPGQEIDIPALPSRSD